MDDRLLSTRGSAAETRSRPPHPGDRWGVWGPIGLRMLALGIALVGLAGIGSAVQRMPRAASAPPPTVVHAGLDLGELPGRALDVVVAAGGGAPSALPCVPTREPPLADAADAMLTGESAATRAPAPPERSAREPAAPSSRAPVVLNRADAAELRRLPGVGAKRAEAILQLRQRLGRFRRISDLLRIKGVGPRTLERMRAKLVLD